MDDESRINTALGKILRSFNFLELNLGLCLRSLVTPADPSSLHSYLSRVGLIQAITRLKELLEEREDISDTGDFDAWFDRVKAVRLLRNYYVHATWEYLSLHEEAPLGFRIPPWRTERIRGNDQGRMRVEDLEADAKRVEAAFNDFMAIRRRYGI